MPPDPLLDAPPAAPHVPAEAPTAPYKPRAASGPGEFGLTGVTERTRFRKVVITGPGRSGTSAVAALLRRCGFYFGDDAGHTVVESLRLNAFLTAGDDSGLRKTLVKNTKEHRLVGWKDPKIFVRGTEFVQSLPDDWLVIAVFRDPVAIALRRTVSDAVDFQESMAHCIEQQRMLQQFAANSGKTVVWMSYERLMLEPEATVDALLARILLEGKAPPFPELWEHMQSHRDAYRRRHKTPARPPAA